MSDTNYHQLLQDSLREIRRLRAERDELVKDRDAKPIAVPIAIVGMACRFPQADSPEALYALAQSFGDGIQRVPADRWDVEQYYDPNHDAKGKMATKAGGFLDDVRGFDAAFFGISPREAKSMDPQQRLLLETTWTALERAAIAPDSLHGKSVGVFVGLSNLEYPNVVRAAGDPGLIDSHFGTGNAGSIAAGRIAYLLGVQGPALIVDTACSSSLVALHLAMNSLRDDECEMAIVGGVNLMLLPETFVHFSNARMLSSDGHCKPFSNQADGYGRGEGCGVLVLKRLDHARRDKNPVDAVIRGSSIKHDGRSAGLTAPNGTSQEMVIQAALQNAGFSELDVHFIEGHGTGTPLGDPIEAAALARSYGKNRTAANPLWVTAIKANIGHTEAAAGMAGIIHAVECLKHRRLSPILNYRKRSEHITSESVAFPTDVLDLKNVVGPVRAGVSSFGFSGTNAHVLLEEYIAQASDVHKASIDDEAGAKHLLVLSAKSDRALRSLAASVRTWLADHIDVSLSQVCATLLQGRSRYANRLAFEATNVADAIYKLDDYARGTSAEGLAGNSPAAERYLNGDNLQDFSQSLPTEVRLVLPTYPFQHSEYWIQPAASTVSSQANTAEAIEPSVVSVDTEPHSDLSLAVFGSSVLSTAGWLQALLKVPQIGSPKCVQFQSLEFLSMVPTGNGSNQRLTIEIEASSINRFQVRGFVGTKTDATTATPSVTGHCHNTDEIEWLGGPLQEVEVLSLESMKVGDLTARLANLGLESAAFNMHVEQLSVGSNECLISLRPLLESSHAEMIHASLAAIDAALCATEAILLSQSIEPMDATAFMPTRIRSIDWFDHQSQARWCLMRLRPTNDSHAIELDVFAWDVSANPVFQMLGVRLEGFSGKPQLMTTSNSAVTTNPVESTTETARLTVESLLKLPRDQRSTSLQQYLRRELAKEMELPEVDIPLEQPLADLGLDSLMIFRLSIQLETELGVTLDSRTLLGGITLRGLTESLLLKLEFVETEEKQS